MKIGVISKLEHCAPHVEALRDLGHKPILLGSDTTEIPDSVELVVLRTQSCSHGASGVAWDWSRRTGGKLLVENGKTSMIRKIRELCPISIHAALPPLEEKPPEGLHTSPPEQEQVTSMSSLKLPKKILLGTRPSSTERFRKAFHYDGLHDSCVLAYKAYNALSLPQIESFEALFSHYDEWFARKDRAGGRPPKPEELAPLFDYLSCYKGRARDFLTFCFYFGLNGRNFSAFKRTLDEIYFQVSGSNLDYALVNCVSWVFDIPLQNAHRQLPPQNPNPRKTPTPVTPTPVTPTPVTPTPATPTPVTESEDLKKKLESVETTVLEIMMSMDALAQRVASLEGKVDTLPTPAALPAMQPPAPASNPFQVLEEVKAMLAAAGFRGELVLKIG